jgi:hypothetical protein
VESWVISVASFVVSLTGIILTYVAVKRNASKDIKEDGEETGSLKTNILYIKDRMKEIITEQKEIGSKVAALTVKVSIIEENSKIDNAKKK